MPREGGAFALAGRSVVGAGFALPRDAGRRPALQENWPALQERCGIRVGRARCCRCWFRAPARCRSETGAPRGWGTRVGWAQCCRCWFRAPARCRSETPTGRTGQRSRRGCGTHVGWARASAGRARWLGARVGWARALAGRARRQGTRVGRARCCRCWFRAPARCRSEAPAGRTGQRSKRVRHSRWLGAVLSVLVSRSRAMPVGDRRSNWPALQVPRSNLPCP